MSTSERTVTSAEAESKKPLECSPAIKELDFLRKGSVHADVETERPIERNSLDRKVAASRLPVRT